MSRLLQTYPREQLTIVGLHDKRLIPYLDKLWSLVAPLRPHTHWGENGNSPRGIRAWIDYHNFMLADDEPIYGTRVVIDETIGDVLGMGSLVPDDRGVAAEMEQEFGTKFAGCWGGFYMFLQRCRIGTVLSKHVDDQIQARVDELGVEQSWLLFTGNADAKMMYEARGFVLRKQGHFVKAFGGREDVFIKTYKPKTV